MKTRISSRTAGFSSLGGIAYLAIIALLVVGGQGLYVAFKNHQPLETTVAGYIARRPDAEWLRLKEGKVSLLEAAYKARVGSISEIFVPVRPPGELPGAPIHILLSTDDKAVVRALQNLSGSRGTLQNKYDAASREADKLFMQRDIVGLARHEIFSDLLTRFRLSRLNMNLADDCVILDDGAAPEAAVSLVMIGGGLLIWFIMMCDLLRNALWRWRRRRAFYRQHSGL